MVQAYAHELLNQKEEAFADDSPLATATRRLGAALDRLEYALGRGKSASPGGADHELVQAECQRLRGALAQLQERYDGLSAAASGVYGKLERSLHKISQMVDA